MTSFGNMNVMGPVVLCLMASIIWAPIVYVLAKFAIHRLQGKLSGPIWRSALILAIVPTVIAPFLALNGVSLRTPTAPLPPMEFAGIQAPVTPERIEVAAEHVTIDPYMTAEKALSAAALIYFYGGLLAFGVWMFKWSASQIAFSRARRDTSILLAEDIDEWRSKLGVQKIPEVFRSDKISSVCMTGFIRPKIMLPAKIDNVLSREEIAIMCAHEIAHIKRGDGALFLALAFVRIFFWFNPIITKLTTRIEQAAEEAADALVVSRGADRKFYANCFVTALKFAATMPMVRLAHAPSFTPVDREGRRKRLESILGNQDEKILSFSERLTIAAIAGGIAAIAFAQAAYAVAPKIEETVKLEIIPVKGKITSAYGTSENIRDGKFHQGIDIKARQWTKIVAPADGQVIASTDLYNDEPNWGKVIVVDHGQGLVTRYAHLGKCLVKEGDKVAAGDVIAKVGATGKVTGPHLHFEVIKNGDYLDPITAFNGNWKPSVYAPKKSKPRPKSKPVKLNKDVKIDAPESFAALDDMDFSYLEGLEELAGLSELVNIVDPEVLLGAGNIADVTISDNHDYKTSNKKYAKSATNKIKKVKKYKKNVEKRARYKAETIRKESKLTKKRIRETNKAHHNRKAREAYEEKIERQEEIREAKRDAFEDSLERAEEKRERARAKIEAKREAEHERRHKARDAKYEAKYNSKQYKREQIDIQMDAITEARRDLEEARRNGLSGIDGTIRELRETERSLKKAKRKLETERS